jgi:acyl-CoA thioesterase-1
MLKRCLSIGFGIAAAMSLAACGADPVLEEEPQVSEIDKEMPVIGEERHILAFGDSLFAGYNVEPEESYPATLERALRARGINVRVANAGISGDTTSAGLQRLAFTLDGQEQKPDLVILELGGNDLLRGIPPSATRSNLSAMIAEIQRRELPILLIGMRAPPNYGPEFQSEFDRLYSDLAAEYGLHLVPFFLEPVYSKPDLMQDDRIHPTAKGIEELVAFTSDEVIDALPSGS